VNSPISASFVSRSWYTPDPVFDDMLVLLGATIANHSEESTHRTCRAERDGKTVSRRDGEER
jgi:hypothetical protein